jgi:hypothetical protein|tara:strand:+ start:2310 stop:2552 length:243 start_codon:yes stop_codon:yes gene_type:complete
MSIEPLNTSSIQQFIQQVKSAESSRARELRIDINQAKNLAFTLGIVMARLNGDLEKFVKENAGGDISDIEVVIGADSDWK